MEKSEESLISITGGCHCRAVTYEAKCTPQISVYKCNCSICEMKQNHHFMVMKDKVTVKLSEPDVLKSYQFNTKVANHLFCGKCGICPFYSPRSNPDCYALTIYCVKNWKNQFEKIHWIDFDGQNWEK